MGVICPVSDKEGLSYALSFLTLSYSLRNSILYDSCDRVYLGTYQLGIPVVVTSILILSAGSVSTRDVNPAFHYGKAQSLIEFSFAARCDAMIHLLQNLAPLQQYSGLLRALQCLNRADSYLIRGTKWIGMLICSTIVLCICLSVSLVSLVCTFRLNAHLKPRLLRKRWRNFPHNGIVNNAIGDEQRLLISSQPETGWDSPTTLTDSPVNSDADTSLSPLQLPSLIDVNLHSTSPYSDDDIRHHEHIPSNPSRIDQMGTPAIHPPPPQVVHSVATESFHQFFILNILLLISMLFRLAGGVCICIWRLTRETEAGVFIAVEFLDQAFNFGQGILIFSVFGFDTDLIISPGSASFTFPSLNKCIPESLKSSVQMLFFFDSISTMGYWVSTNLSWPSLPTASRLREEEVEQFVAIQLPLCMQQICATLCLSGHTFESVFYFRDFHQWVSQKSAAEGRHHLREDTASLLMALATRNLIRRLTGSSEAIRGAEREEVADSAVSNSSATSSPHLSRLSEPDEAPVLYQYLGSP
ncbi:hypothetical protein ACTXT7_002394 [Hymenolepis weldensis]